MALSAFSQETFLEAILRGTKEPAWLLGSLQAVARDSRNGSMEMHGVAVQAQSGFCLGQKIIGYRAMRLVAYSAILIYRFMFENKRTLGMGMARNTALTTIVFHREGHIVAMDIMTIQTAHNTLIQRMMRGHIK